MIDTTQLRPADLADHFLSRGQFAFTLDDAAAALGGRRRTAADGVERLRHHSLLFSPARGLYVAVPPEYRSWGVVPGSWFIDAMMGHLHRSYYVALLNAAAVHGASHQAPQVFQVMTERASD